MQGKSDGLAIMIPRKLSRRLERLEPPTAPRRTGEGSIANEEMALTVRWEDTRETGFEFEAGTAGE